MKVRMTATIDTSNKRYTKGRVVEISPRKAESWIKRGVAVEFIPVAKRSK